MKFLERVKSAPLFSLNTKKAGYYFFHIPKTAGTSVNALLESAFSQHKIAPCHLLSQMICYSQKKVNSYELYRGHFYNGIYTIVSKPLTSIVFLRDPIARALSHYGHVVRDTHHYLHSRSLELGSLEHYIEDPLTRETVHNFQAKALVMEFNPVILAQKMTQEQLLNLELEKQIETNHINLADDVLLEKAKEKLRSFAVIGLTEMFNDSVFLLERCLNKKFKKTPATLNINPLRISSANLSSNELKKLKEINRVDIELHNYAAKLFKQQMSKYI